MDTVNVSEKDSNDNIPMPLPLFSMKISLDYLMDFYIHTVGFCDCGLSLDNPCNCFSNWLNYIYKFWHELGKTKTNVYEQEGKTVNPYKEFDLSDMVKVFNEIPDKKTLSTFLSELPKYFAIRVVCHYKGTKVKQRYWYPDGQTATFPRYKNLKKLVTKCPYI